MQIIFLTCDIDITAYNFIPIGTESEPFIGEFDGCSHHITGLYINNPSSPTKLSFLAHWLKTQS